jgi:hypothetical protein
LAAKASRTSWGTVVCALEVILSMGMVVTSLRQEL